MWFKTFFSMVFVYYCFFYIFGLINLVMLCFALTFDDPFHLIPGVLNDHYAIFNFYKTATGCYTITFTIICQATIFRQDFHKPLRAAVHLVFAFIMMLFLVMIMSYTTISLYALLLFCFFGGQFAGLLVLNVSMLSRENNETTMQDNYPRSDINIYRGVFHITDRM